ncbi:MAG: hypothetical protein M1381_08740 [Deltaproteobacteria bacterium]|nr:hypothetical protein [Deltaproteobacteria bacterium]
MIVSGIMVLFAECGNAHKSVDISPLINTGKNAILNSSPQDALVQFSQALKANPNSCDAHWGMVLAASQDIMNNQATTFINNL